MDREKHLRQMEEKGTLIRLEAERLLSFVKKNHGEIKNHDLAVNHLLMGSEFIANRFTALVDSGQSEEFIQNEVLQGAKVVTQVLLRLVGIEEENITDDDEIAVLRRIMDMLGDVIFNN